MKEVLLQAFHYGLETALRSDLAPLLGLSAKSLLSGRETIAADFEICGRAPAVDPEPGLGPRQPTRAR